jgi:carboxymethylenebutenolidase
VAGKRPNDTLTIWGESTQKQAMQTLHTAQPKSQPKGAIILLHEAFGLTPHIRRNASSFAAEGYLTLAPDLFSLILPADNRPAPWQTDGQFSWLPQNKQGLDTGRELIPTITPAQIATLLTQTLQGLTSQHPNIPTATLGYCWGGSVSYLAAKRVPGLACAVSYYGGKLNEFAAQPPKPQIPCQIHLAKLDRYIPYQETTEAFAHHHPEAEVYGYDADHGFNRDDGPTYDEAAAQTARQRTLQFLAKNLK